jgi:hypothetical protein
VGRTLRGLVRDGKLLKLGYGVYTRAVKSSFNDKPIPSKGLATLSEALKRLGVKIAATKREQTTQVPTGRVVAVRGCISRKLG